MTPNRYGFLALLGMLLFAGSVRAQEATILTEEPSAVAQPVAAEMAPDTTATAPRLPLKYTDPSPSTILANQPGVFAWTFGSAGWPDAPSFFGTDPNRVELSWDGQQMDDLLTARPRYDLVPIGLSRGGGWMSDGSAAFTADALETDTPETRIRYTSASDGLQGIHSLHVQNRSFGPDSSRSRLQTVFGYAGAGATGEYDGSKLRRAREVAFRIRWETSRYTLQLDEVAIRRSVGAHTGVEQFGSDPESIFQRLGATVGDESARRRTIRNDLRFRGSTNLRGFQTRLDLERHSQTHDFSGQSLALRAMMVRWKATLTQSKTVGAFQVGWDAFVQRDDVLEGNVWYSLPGYRSFQGATLQASWSTSNTSVNLHAGPRIDDTRTWLNANAEIRWTKNRLTIRGSALTKGLRPALIDEVGMTGVVSTVPSEVKTNLQQLRLGVDWFSRWFSITLDGVLRSEIDPLVHQLNEDGYSLSSVILNGSRQSSGVSLVIGLRDRAARGLYAQLNPSFRASSANASSELGALWEDAAPTSWISGRIGARALLFKSDLDLDAFIRVRGWNSMSGRRLHTVTGLLVLPSDGEIVESDWMVDLVAEGGVRGATLFLALENILSGTNVQIGNVLIPDYPLPQQRLRFGVYWPIKN